MKPPNEGPVRRLAFRAWGRRATGSRRPLARGGRGARDDHLALSRDASSTRPCRCWRRASSIAEDPEKSRKLIGTNRPELRVVLVRATDVPTYVQHGGADLGVAGKDVLIEHGGEGLYQPLDLRIARCRMSVAVRDDFDYAAAVKQGSRIRVATKYTQTAREFFADQGRARRPHQALRLDGAGAADRPGRRHRRPGVHRQHAQGNHLVEVERIMDISSRLVVNQAALKLKREPIRALIDAFATGGNPPEGVMARRPGHRAAPISRRRSSALLHWSAETDAAIEGRVWPATSWPTCSGAATPRCWTDRAV